MPNDNEWEKILFDPSEVLPIDDDADPDLDDEGIEAECKHQRELDRIIADDKITADDPLFEQRASHRRSTVYAHDKLKVAIGAKPDDGEIIPPPSDAEYVPAPKAATDFVVQTRKRRRPKRAVPNSNANGGSGRKIATIWDGIKL